MTETRTYVPVDTIEIVERPIRELQYRVSIGSEDVAGFDYFYDACEYANAQIGVTPVGSHRSNWVKAMESDNAGCEFWTYQG
jgi:hypothetical protein